MIPRKESNAMKTFITAGAIPARELKMEALTSLSASFEKLCLAAGLEALGDMMARDAQAACGPRHALWQDRRDPALSNPQGAQHHGSTAEGASRFDAPGAAPGLGTR